MHKLIARLVVVFFCVAFTDWAVIMVEGPLLRLEPPGVVTPFALGALILAGVVLLGTIVYEVFRDVD